MATWRSELRPVLALAWPVALGQIASMSMTVVDTLLVGRLDATAMASVALGSWWSLAITIVPWGALRAIDPIVSQAHGAGEAGVIRATLGRGVVLAALMSIPAVALHLAAGPALRALGQPGELISTAAAYCALLAVACPAFLLFAAVRQFLQARAILRPATTAILVANVINALVGYSLVLGQFGAPALGVLGAGCATIASAWFQLAFLLWLARKEVFPFWPGWRVAAAPGPLVSLARIAGPLGLQTGTEAWAFGVASFLVGPLGTVPVAAHSVVMNVCTLTFMVPLGVSSAASTRVGHLVGAGLPWRATAGAALVLGPGFMAISASMLALFPGAITRAYTADAAVIAFAATLFPVAAAFQLFDGTQVVAFGILRGAGDTTLPSLANVVGYWFVGLPLGAWLAFRAGFGAVGIWMGLAIALATVAILLLARLSVVVRRGGVRVRA